MANDSARGGRQYIGYEYKTVTLASEDVTLYLDGYENFGWTVHEAPRESVTGVVRLTLKRDRKIVNKAELTRLQRHFEAVMDEIRALEHSKTRAATGVSISVGVLGTACMAGSVFAVTSEPPIIWLCVLLAIPGFIGWALPLPVFRRMARKRAGVVEPLIDQKRDEADTICEKGCRLLGE